MRSVSVIGGVLLALVTPALAGPGHLDPTFGVGGVVLEDVTAEGDLGACLGVQSDGRLIVCLRSGEIVRFLADGTRDMDFGTGGIARVPTDPPAIYAWAVAIDADDGFLITGFSGMSRLLLARFDADGAIDPSFGTGGVVDVGDGQDVGFDVVRLSDQRILVAIASYADLTLQIARFGATGAADASFGVGGVVTIPLFTALKTRLVVQPDGKILVPAVQNYGLGRESSFAVARLDANGVPDDSFGNAGIAVVHVPTQAASIDGQSYRGSTASSLVLRADGRIVGVGHVARGAAGLVWALAGLLPDGRLDPAFGQGGLAVVDPPGGDYGLVFDLLEAADGKLIVVGGSSRELPQVTIGRFNPDGGLDPTFGVDGFVGAGPATGSPAWGYGIASVQLDDGRLVTAGHRPEGADDFHLMLARYEMTCAIPGSCTPCTGAHYLDAVHIKGLRVLPPAGDAALMLTASGRFSHVVDPLATGIRVLVENPENGVLADVAVPGGAYDPAAKVGWKGGNGKFAYRNAGTAVPRPGGIAKVAMKVDSRGRLKLKLQIKDGSLSLDPSTLPFQLWIALDPPTAESGACVVSPPAMSCALDVVGDRLRCE